MTALKTILTGAAGLAAAVGFASPAAAQYYPSNNGGVLGAILNGVIGGGQYGYGGYVNDRMAVDQCARSVEARINGYGNYGSYGGYGNYGYGNNSYGAGGRIQQITRVERRSGGGFKVYGLASSNANGGYNGGYYGGGYGNYGAYADLKFNCKVDSRGRVTDVDIDRNNSNYNPYGYRRY